jgi:hypothetical protein
LKTAPCSSSIIERTAKQLVQFLILFHFLFESDRGGISSRPVPSADKWNIENDVTQKLSTFGLVAARMISPTLLHTAGQTSTLSRFFSIRSRLDGIADYGDTERKNAGENLSHDVPFNETMMTTLTRCSQMPSADSKIAIQRHPKSIGESYQGDTIN